MKILILGAGAIGTVLGHLLTKKKGKNTVTFLVRDSKVAALSGSTINLFHYDTKKLIPFSDFSVLSTDALTSSPGDFAAFDLVILTLHTDALISDVGKTLVANIAKAVSPTACFLSLSPGFNVTDQVFTPAGVKKDRVAYGLPFFLCHEVPIHGQPEGPKYNQRSEAKLAFTYLVGSYFPLMIGKNPHSSISKALKGAGGMAMNYGNTVLEAATVVFLILNLMLNLQDYPKSLNKKDEKFTVAMQAFRQIMNFYGFVGSGAKVFVGKNMIKITDWSNRKMTQPLTMDFIKYHHGNKVVEQNLGIIESYIAYGQEKGKPVDKIEQFVGYFRKADA
eukprot:augustus_masked-scaffold_53-processed-gene-1.35-mRNA-1 protein AED:1.00 eAED:1.00 QI:0/-1/0/0/-1/1/1/0/333